MALLTRYVNHAIVGGSDNGETEVDAWKYIYQATAAMLADATAGAFSATTNQWKVFVKSGEDYGADNGGAGSPSESDDTDHDGAGGDAGSILYLDTLGQALFPNVFEGYTDTPGDGGIATFDCNYTGASKLTDGIWFGGNWAYYTIFKNFDVLNAGADGGQGGVVGEFITCKNCRFKNNSNNGVSGDNGFSFENCVFDGNGIDGVNADNELIFVSCIVKYNDQNGIQGLKNCVVYNTLVYDNGNVAQIIFNGLACVFSSTIDSNDGAASRGIHQDSAIGLLHTANCIIVDAAIGILADGDMGDRVISRNNLFNGNTDDASAYQTEYDGGDGVPSTGDGVGNLGHVTGVPGFTGTYVPGANAQNAMLDAHFTNAFWASFDGANNPPL